MPLDVDRLADAMLEGARALIAKATAPLIASNEELRAQNESLQARLVVLEGRPTPATLTEGDVSNLATKALAADLLAVREKAEEAVSIAAAVKDAVAALPPAPELPELPVIPELPDIGAMVSEAVIAAVAAIEPPEAPDLSEAINEAARAAVGALQPAKAADPEEIEALRAEIAAVRREIPTVHDAPDHTGLATKAEMDALALRLDGMPAPKDFAPEITALGERIAALPGAPDLSDLATKEEVAAAVADVRRDIPAVPEVIHGKNGAGIAEVKQNADGELICKLSNGETFNAGRVRGADGFGFDDLSVEHDGERALTLIFAKGERVERKEILLPIVIDRGVWRDGEFKRGDGVTWAGSFWIAQRDTSDKPETSDAWRLSVKRGRDGKNAQSHEPKTGPVKRGS